MPFKKEYYPVNWLTTIRPAVLKKANYRCQNCGVVNHSMGFREDNGEFIELDQVTSIYAAIHKKKVLKIHLTVSHQDHDTYNNSPSNLKALCQKCHLQHDKELHSISRKARKSTSLPPPFSSLEFR